MGLIIKTVIPQKPADFERSIHLLNEIFTKFFSQEEYNSKFAFDKTYEHDPLIFEAYENDQLVGFALCYERTKSYYHIWDLGVDEKIQREGNCYSYI